MRPSTAFHRSYANFLSAHEAEQSQAEHELFALLLGLGLKDEYPKIKAAIQEASIASSSSYVDLLRTACRFIQPQLDTISIGNLFEKLQEIKP